MCLVNHDTKEVQFKIVYCGAACAGKTTNLQHIHARIDDDRRGDLLSMATGTDREVFFDYLPIDAVLIRGYHTKFQLYTVPGAARCTWLPVTVLRGADGIVFVVDSTSGKLEEAKQCLETTRENLRQNGVDPEDMPWVYQLNKRDQPGVPTVDDMRARLGLVCVETIEAVASQGFNVFATLNVVAQECLERFHGSLPQSVQ
jgi:signal recognition particle receptor subunit beta